MNYRLSRSRPAVFRSVQLWEGNSGRDRDKSEWQLTREVNPDCTVGSCHSPFNSGTNGRSPEENFEEFDESW